MVWRWRNAALPAGLRVFTTLTLGLSGGYLPMRMRVSWASAVLALASVLAFSPITTRAQVQFQFSAGVDIGAVSDFYNPLAPFGVWVDLPPYGRCWHPNVEHGWLPYAYGHWEWTDLG